MKTILMLLNKDKTTDPRVSKETAALSHADYQVSVCDVKGRPEGMGLVRTAIDLAMSYLRFLKLSHRLKFDVIHAHDFDTLPIGALIARLRGVPLVYDAHESYSDMVAGDVPPAIQRLLRATERRLTTLADRIILANERIGQRISDEPDKWSVVMNCPGEISRPSTSSSGEYFLGYFGSLIHGRFIQGLIDAVNETSDWNLLIAGKGSFELRDVDGEKIKFLGALPPHEATDEMCGCSLLSVIFEDGNANDIIGTPNRLFEAMALGIPVIASKSTYSGEIVESTGCGFSLTPTVGNLTRLLDHLGKHPELLSEKGNNGYDAWKESYNWASQKTKLIDLYRRLAKKTRA